MPRTEIGRVDQLGDGMNSYTPPALSSVMGVLDTHLRYLSYKSSGSRRYKKYHPSEWGRCLRRQQYKHYVELGFIKAEPEELSSKQCRLFDKGHNMHDRWARYFEDIGVLRGIWVCKNPGCHKRHGEDHLHGAFKPEKCECGNMSFFYNEVPVRSEEFNFAGHADQILDFSQFDGSRYNGVRSAFNVENLPRHPFVIDMKTCNDYAFKSKIKKVGPHMEYVIQLTIYTHLLNLPFGMLIYENKNDSDIGFFQVDRNEELFGRIREQSLLMQKMVENRLLPPPRPNSKSDWECKSCDFRAICHPAAIWQDPDLEQKRKGFYGMSG